MERPGAVERPGPLVRTAPVLRCPVCGKPLQRDDGAYQCESRHAFDVAREGYVNLVLSHQKRSREPGYNSEMMRSRRRILSSGLYDPLVETLVELVLDDREQLAVLDAGCGEGHYLTSISSAARARRRALDGWGIDLSKTGVRMAARRDPSSGWVVGNVFAMPFLDGTFDDVLSVFSPVVWEEFDRVLTARGRVVVVGPGPQHLRGLKAVLYQEPQEFDVPAHLDVPAPFTLEFSSRVTADITVEGNEAVRDLLQMTPYYWSVPPPARDRALRLPALRTPVDFDVSVYRKRR